MRIKELHLRNIASIEKADIDFTKDLNDRYSGEPASVFLISGDTGAGKSVILDGISMALYKKTPRLESVADKRKNNFISYGGEEVGINSIEQYTRMGISQKDECYSEVCFDGNDGVEYRARLTLGMALSNTTATRGRCLKHREPAWTVKVGSGDWRKENKGETILAAIGLSFEQFCRMAMLAQGKFESFLTGDKSQREEVLEQLTNTQQFSEFGEAISQMFSERKSIKERHEALVKDESGKPMPTEVAESLKIQKTQELQQLKDIEERQAKAEALKSAVQSIISNEAIISEAEGKKKALTEKMESDEYLKDKAFITDWDATETQRHALAELNAALLGKKRCENDLERQHADYSALCSDIEARKKEAEDGSRLLEQARKDTQAARELSEAKQKEIDALSEQRKALEPAKVNAELSKTLSMQNALDWMTREIAEVRTYRAERDRLNAMITKDSEKAEALMKAAADANAEYDAAKTAADNANTRFATMNASIDSTLIELRHRLREEHAETCPLCGQHIHDILIDDGFRQILSPLDEERKAATKRLEAADAARRNANSASDSISAAIKANRSTLEGILDKIQKKEKGVLETGRKCGFDVNTRLEPQIDEASAKVNAERTRLENLQRTAESLLQSIDKAMKEKKPLDSALTSATDNENRRQTALSNLVSTIKNLETFRDNFSAAHKDWKNSMEAPKIYRSDDILYKWNSFTADVTRTEREIDIHNEKISDCSKILEEYCQSSGKTRQELEALISEAYTLDERRRHLKDIENEMIKCTASIEQAQESNNAIFASAGFKTREDVPQMEGIDGKISELKEQIKNLSGQIATIDEQFRADEEKARRFAQVKADYEAAQKEFDKWSLLNKYFGGKRFRTLVQTHILKPLLNNANIYLTQITDRYELTCSEDNEQLSILVRDNYMKQLRSSTVLSGGEKFMVSLALSLALSSLNRPGMSVNILFIDEGFGTLDKDSLDSVMETLERLQSIAGESNRRVGIISHREELEDRIPVQIRVEKKGQGRSAISIINK